MENEFPSNKEARLYLFSQKNIFSSLLVFLFVLYTTLSNNKKAVKQREGSVL